MEYSIHRKKKKVLFILLLLCYYLICFKYAALCTLISNIIRNSAEASRNIFKRINKMILLFVK